MITIDSEHLGIPETQYSSIVTMSSNEFTRICRELFALNETVTIETKKGYIKFTVSGENANGSIKIEENTTSDENEATTVQVEEDVKLDFALRYFYFYFLDI